MQKELPLTEGVNPDTKELDAGSVALIIDVMLNEDKAALDAVSQARVEIGKAVETAIDTFKGGGRLFYVGAGTSGRLGVLDASECPPTFSVPTDMVQGIIAGGDAALRKAIEGAEDDEEAGRQAIHDYDVKEGDMVMGISASGLAAFVRGALEEAKMLGAKTWLLTGNPAIADSIKDLSFMMDGIITVNTGPEMIAGSTRLKAGTATKLVLNMITTVSMIKLGKVYGNLMVDVNPTNKKLRDRAGRIISQITGCTAEEALELLEKSGNRPKVAVMMKIKGIGREEAERILAATKGFLRHALSI